MWLMVVDDGVGMVQGQQVYKGMPVGLHFVLNALVCESAHLLYPHVDLNFQSRTELTKSYKNHV